MATLLYSRNPSEEKIQADIEIKKFSPRLFGLFIEGENKTLKNTIARLYFRLMAGEKYVIYYVTSDDGVISHTSTVMPRCFKFRYLLSGECEIGPCYTHKDFRGRGIYPKVLHHILSDYKAEKFYMTVHETNNSSIRGIEKAGFERCGCIKKSKVLKIYRKAEEKN